MKKLAAVALTGFLAIPFLAMARHLDLQDADDTRGLLDVQLVEVTGGGNNPRWKVSTFARWSERDVWDTGFVLVRLDSFGTGRADYYALVRSNGRELSGHLFRDREKQPDRRLRSVQVQRDGRRSVSVVVELNRLKRRGTKEYSWFVQTLFSSDNCRSVCIDRVPDRGKVAEPGAGPAPTPSLSPLPTPSP